MYTEFASNRDRSKLSHLRWTVYVDYYPRNLSQMNFELVPTMICIDESKRIAAT